MLCAGCGKHATSAAEACICGGLACRGCSEFVAHGVVCVALDGENAQQMAFLASGAGKLLGSTQVEQCVEPRSLRLTGCTGTARAVLEACHIGIEAQRPLNRREPEVVAVDRVWTDTCMASGFSSTKFCSVCNHRFSALQSKLVRPCGRAVCQNCALTLDPAPAIPAEATAIVAPYCGHEEYEFILRILVRITGDGDALAAALALAPNLLVPRLVQAVRFGSAGRHNLSVCVRKLFPDMPRLVADRALAYALGVGGAGRQHDAAVKIQSLWRGYAYRRVCRICLEMGASHMGCACRGPSAHAHTGCRVELAIHCDDRGKWLMCDVCKRRHHGKQYAALLSALQDRVAHLEVGHPERAAVMTEMANFLAEHEDPQKGIEILEVVAKSMAELSERALFPPLEVALAKCEVRDNRATEAATRLRRAIDYCRTQMDTKLKTWACYYIPQMQMEIGMLALEMRLYEAAKSQFARVLPALIARFGPDSEEATHYGAMGLAAAELGLNPHTERHRFFVEFERIRRIFGPSHPHTCHWIELRKSIGVPFATAEEAAAYELEPVFVLKTTAKVNAGEMLTADKLAFVCQNADRLPPGAAYDTPSVADMFTEA